VPLLRRVSRASIAICKSGTGTKSSAQSIIASDPVAAYFTRGATGVKENLFDHNFAPGAKQQRVPQAPIVS
jgi:hypothetical protein